MTIEDMENVLAINQATFPNFYKGIADVVLELAADAWLAMFGNLDKKTFMYAFYAALKVKKFPVVPADIFEQISLMENATQKSEEELWNEFVRAARVADSLAAMFRYTAIFPYETMTQGEKARAEAVAVFEELPDEIRAFCHSVSGLIDYGNRTRDELTQFVKPNFMKRIPQLRERARVIKETPKEFLELTKGLADKLTDSPEIKCLNRGTE